MANEQNLKPYQPGQSGNPNGRPKKLPELDVLLAEVLSDEKNGMNAAEAILKKLREMAVKGNLRAAEILLDRAYGKAKERHEHTGKDGKALPMSLNITVVDAGKHIASREQDIEE